MYHSMTRAAGAAELQPPRLSRVADLSEVHQLRHAGAPRHLAPTAVEELLVFGHLVGVQAVQARADRRGVAVGVVEKAMF